VSSINKKSLREEFDGLKQEFKQLLSEGKISKESRVLFGSMLMLFELMLVVFMEKTTKKNNANSSIPSSQTQKDESSILPKDPKGSNGKGNKENKKLSKNTRTVETKIISKVVACGNCGEDLSSSPSQQYERRTIIDIIFEKQVKHVDAEIKTYPNCEQSSKGTFPSNMSGPLQYGTGLKSYMLNLLMAQMVSLNRIQKSIKTLIGVIISEATILKYVIQLYVALEKWEGMATAQILKAPAINVDETSLRVDKKKQWIHVYSAGEITLKYLEKGRGIEAIENIGIIPKYGGVIIHDCLAAYLSYNHCGHGLCGSHLLRELQFVIESNEYTWAKNMKKTDTKGV
jgi:transposase